MKRACDSHVEKGIPFVDFECDNPEISVLDILVLNNASNKKYSFQLPVTLWVYDTKVQANALKDSGATMSFINKSFVEKHHLVTNKLATPYNVTNADGTLNEAGTIKEFVRAYMDNRYRRASVYPILVRH